MADEALMTEMRLQLVGVAEAVNGLKAVGMQSQTLGTYADQGGQKFGGLAKVIGHVGGVSRYEMMALRGLQEAIESAGNSWKGFAQSVGQTAAFAGLALALTWVVTKAKELSAETDEIYKKMGKPVPGFWANLATGWGFKGAQDGGGYDAPTASERAGIHAGALAADAKDYWQKTAKEGAESQFARRFKSATDGMKYSSEEKMRIASSIRADIENAGEAGKEQSKEAAAESKRKAKWLSAAEHPKFAGADEAGSLGAYKSTIAAQYAGVGGGDPQLAKIAANSERSISIEQRVANAVESIAKSKVPIFGLNISGGMPGWNG